MFECTEHFINIFARIESYKKCAVAQFGANTRSNLISNQH